MIYPKKFFPTKKQRNFAVKLAKDILSTFMIKKGFEVEGGEYCIIEHDEYDYLKFDKSLQKYLEQKVVNCRVCALGAFFVSKVKLKNKIDIDQKYGDYNAEVQGISVDIGGLNAQLIETAFEQIHITSRYTFDNLTLYEDCLLLALNNKAANSFKSDNPRKRLQAICRNVIRNNGIFVPRGVELEQ